MSQCAPRGRPRSAEASRAILAAALELMASEGYQGLTIEAVAYRSGVAKTTIYRRWSSKEVLAAEALRALGEPTEVPDTGSVRDDLVALTEHLLRPGGRSEALLRAVLAEAGRNPVLAEAWRRVLQQQRAPVVAVLERGTRRGELPADLDVSAAVDLLLGAVWTRHLVGTGTGTGTGEPCGAPRLVDALVRGCGAGGDRKTGR